MKLQHFWSAGGIVDFDPATGRVRRFAGRGTTHWGFAWKQRWRWFALWHDGESLVFQHRDRQWRFTPDVELAVSGLVWRRFEISRDGRREFRFRYWFRGSVLTHLDPTYDAIDEEADDFFVYVTSMWAHWKDRSFDEFLALIRMQP